MAQADPFDLDRFLEAQTGVYAEALAELVAGHKRSHWMWFVFPQLRGLGRSPMAERYGVGSLAEARAFLAHPLLGPRLRACAEAVLGHADLSLHEIFGSPDDQKFVSSMSLFRLAQGGDGVPFQTALDRWAGGSPDRRTLELLGL